jgi:hypothetical protein
LLNANPSVLSPLLLGRPTDHAAASVAAEAREAWLTQALEADEVRPWRVGCLGDPRCAGDIFFLG